MPIIIAGKRGARGSKMTWSATTVTGSYTASSGERVKCDPSAGNVVIKSPSSPSVGSVFTVKNMTSSSVSMVVEGNGFDVEVPLDAFTLTSSAAFGDDSIAITWEFIGDKWLII